MARVTLTSHLFSFFPQLKGKRLEISADTVAGVVGELEKLAPGFAFYVCDEAGRLRQHVNIFVESERIADRQQLSDRVDEQTQVLIVQALSGG